MEIIGWILSLIWTLLGYVVSAVSYIFLNLPMLELLLGFLAFYTLIPWLSIFSSGKNFNFNVFLSTFATGFIVVYIGYDYAPYYVIGGAAIAVVLGVLIIVFGGSIEPQDPNPKEEDITAGFSESEIIAHEAVAERIRFNHQINALKYALHQAESKDNDPYQILGIEPSASVEEAVKAHRKLVRKYHPDLASTTTEEIRLLAEERLLLINGALDMIKNS